MKPVNHTARSKITPGVGMGEGTACTGKGLSLRAAVLWRRGSLIFGALFLFGIMLLFAACGPVRTPTSTDTAPAPSISTATATARPVRLPTQTVTPTSTPVPRPVSTLGVKDTDLKGVTLQFWYPHSGQAETLLRDMVVEFNRTNRWGITIQPKRQNGPGGMDEQFDAAQAATSLPDVLAGYIEQAAHWDAAGGVLVDLDPYIADPIWGLTADVQQDFYPVIWSEDVISATLRAQNGSGTKTQLKRVGLPWYRTGVALLYNQTWARELGFTSDPHTPDEFRRQACAAAQFNLHDLNRQNDGSGGWLITPDAPTLLSWIFAYNGEIVRPDGKGYQFNTPETENALKFLKGLSTSGCAWQSAEESSQSVFAARGALFYAAPLDDLPLQQAAMQAATSKDSWTVLPFPSISDHPGLLVYGPSVYIVQSSPAKQLAGWLFAKWLASPENQARWVEANGDLPTRAAALTLLDKNGGLPQWQQALALLPLARSQPNLASWSTLRWVMADSQAQLFSPDFSVEKIPALLKMMDELASEIYTQGR